MVWLTVLQKLREVMTYLPVVPGNGASDGRHGHLAVDAVQVFGSNSRNRRGPVERGLSESDA
jgi:hypothetical protein